MSESVFEQLPTEALAQIVEAVSRGQRSLFQLGTKRTPAGEHVSFFSLQFATYKS